MRRSIACLILLLAACSSSSGLTQSNASLVATIGTGVTVDQVRPALTDIAHKGNGVEEATIDEDARLFLVRFADEATTEQKQAVLARLGETALFSSIVCGTCSPGHGNQPRSSPSR